MNDSRILIICNNRQDWLFNAMEKTGLVKLENAYKKVNTIEKFIRRGFYHLPINRALWYGDWKKRLDEFETIILFDVFLGDDMVEYIIKKAPKSELHVFYWNPIANNYTIRKELMNKCKVWSFDQKDCEIYKLRFNHQFFFFGYKDAFIDKAYRSDIFFIGRDKDRLQLLMQLSNIFNKEGLKSKIIVTRERKKVYSKEEKRFLSLETIPYEETLRYSVNTKCLLEIMQKGQEGFTLRTLEAMFFNKKLITNNIRIREYDFYDPRNIYIIGYDLGDIKDFILGNDAKWNSDYLQKYSFEDWLSNFFTK